MMGVFPQGVVGQESRFSRNSPSRPRLRHLYIIRDLPEPPFPSPETLQKPLRRPCSLLLAVLPSFLGPRLQWRRGGGDQTGSPSPPHSPSFQNTGLKLIISHLCSSPKQGFVYTASVGALLSYLIRFLLLILTEFTLERSYSRMGNRTLF